MNPLTTPLKWKNSPFPDGNPYITIGGGCHYFDADRLIAGFSVSGILSEEDARRLVASFNALLALPIEKVEQLAEAAAARLPKEAAEHLEQRFEETL